jgi:hypothetical protein
VCGDISRFAQSIVDNSLPKKPEGLRHALAAVLVDKSQGMFLWVKLQEHRLSRRRHHNLQLLMTVQALPNLERAYGQSWSEILQLESYQRRRALAILRWAFFAMRPLTVREIVDALIIFDDNDDCDDLLRDELPDFLDRYFVDDEIIGLCNGLVVFSRTGTSSDVSLATIHLSHHSVREFLVTAPFPQFHTDGDGVPFHDHTAHNNRLASLCLRYLQFQGAWENEDGAHCPCPFIDYAARLWHHHVYHGGDGYRKVLAHVEKFFRGDNLRWIAWRDYVDDAHQGVVEQSQHDNGQQPDVSYYATLYGFADVVTDAEKRMLGITESNYISDDDGSVISVVPSFPPSHSSRMSLEHEVHRLGVENIVSCLVSDEDLSLTIPKALTKMSSDRLNRNLARLLGRYAGELHVSATDCLQRGAAALVTRNRASIARYVCGRLDPAQASRRLEMDRLRAESSHGQEHLERFIAQLRPAANSMLADKPASAKRRETQRSIMSELRDDFEEEDLPTLQQVRQFMFHSSAMVHLHENFARFVFPNQVNEDEAAYNADRGNGELRSGNIDNNADDDIMLSIALLYADPMKTSDKEMTLSADEGISSKIDKDSTFFEQIQTAYEDICSTRVVRYTEGTPDWVRAAVRLSYGLGGAFEKFIIKVFDWLHVRWLVQTVGNSVFFVPSTANFVQV